MDLVVNISNYKVCFINSFRKVVYI
jgi:hypothetical protein